MATSTDLHTLIQLEEDEEYDFELAQRRMEAERAAREEEAFKKNTLNLDIPPLPSGKTHHLFISHSNDPPDELAWAEQLVNTMERDYGLKCLWPKRDFTPGHDVGSLIQSGILSSVKVVFILSPASMESRWCEYERNFAFGISVESKENQIIPVMFSQCDFPGILKTLNYIDVPAGEEYAFKIRRCFDEDTRDMKYLVPEIKHREKNIGPLNGQSVQIFGGKRVKSWRGPAWWFSSLDQHQRYQLRQLGSKFAEKTYYEASYVINNSFRMKYFSLFNSCGRCCSWYCISFVLWFLVVAFIVGLIHSTRSRLYDATFMWFGIVPGLLTAQIIASCIMMKMAERRVQKWVRNYSLRHVLETNIFIHVDFTKPSIHIMYYNIKPCLKYICDKMHETLVDGDETCQDVNKEETARTIGRRKFFSFIESNYESLFSSTFNESVVARHPTSRQNKCICEVLEKVMFDEKKKTEALGLECRG
ncbi:uncharacterized protein LOC124135148 isoform X1 [Haliotis rufescens]|uniref:uncharacterized protein LOC124135148 isoform X1 n=1 Tax=Haliotis rufescens TaxID=6454 RepID=UPI00201F87DE|nr:uncharacterized protein LOC124135148 isoform X1 [Haliotis rufescens]